MLEEYEVLQEELEYTKENKNGEINELRVKLEEVQSDVAVGRMQQKENMSWLS